MKRAWLLLLLAACATANPAGIYSGYAPLPKGESRQVRVSLLADGAASVQEKYSNQPEGEFAEGQWRTLADGRIAVDLSTGHLLFRLRGNQLVAEEWDPRYWGEKGLGALYRVR
jgi:hypothetical protein